MMLGGLDSDVLVLDICMSWLWLLSYAAGRRIQFALDTGKKGPDIEVMVADVV